MNSEYHDQVSQPIIFKRGTTLVAAGIMRRGFAVAILMLIAGCSGGEGVALNPPQSPSPPPALRRPHRRRRRRRLRQRRRHRHRHRRHRRRTPVD